MKLRAAYFCYPSAYSLCFLNLCLRVHALPIRTVLFSKAAGFASGQPLSFSKVALKTIRGSGLRYAAYELAFTTGSSLLSAWHKLSASPDQRLLTFEELREEYDLQYHESRDFNEPPTKAFLEDNEIDLGLSAFNNQLFRKPLITWFEERRGIFNVHPAALPDFRGVEPIVPLLLHKRTTAGVTLHSVNPKIDEGVIHYQETYAVEPDDSVFSLNHKAWHEGAGLAKRLMHDLAAGNTLPSRDQESLAVEFGYAPFPTREEVTRLRATGRRLIRLRHLRALHRFPPL